MKMVSTGGFAPRPLVRSEQVYSSVIDGELYPLPILEYRPPATGDAATRYKALGSGEIEPNDFGSFPSDHAALFLALAFGIFLAARGAGAIALVWAVAVTLGSRVITGLHSPLDVLVGGAIGVGSLMVVLTLARRVPSRLFDRILDAANRWPGAAAVLIVIALFEVAEAMGTLKRLVELGGSVVSGGA